MLEHMTDEHLLTPREVSEYLNVRVATLAAWRYTGDGPAYVRLGRMIRYQRSDIEDYVSVSRVDHPSSS